MHFTATFLANPPPQAPGTQYFAMDVDEVPVAGSRLDRLTEVRAAGAGSAAHRGAERRTCAWGYRVLDALVPQLVDQAAEVVRFFVSLLVVAEQVIPSRSEAADG